MTSAALTETIVFTLLPQQDRDIPADLQSPLNLQILVPESSQTGPFEPRGTRKGQIYLPQNYYSFSSLSVTPLQRRSTRTQANDVRQTRSCVVARVSLLLAKQPRTISNADSILVTEALSGSQPDGREDVRDVGRWVSGEPSLTIAELLGRAKRVGQRIRRRDGNGDRTEQQAQRRG